MMLSLAACGGSGSGDAGQPAQLTQKADTAVLSSSPASNTSSSESTRPSADAAGNAATAADKYFQQLLPLLSGKGKANIQYEYGSFLASSAQIERAIPVLQESVAGGNKEAHKALAMALLAQDKKADAIREMKTYIQLFPKDSEAQHLLQAIETGNIRREDVSAK